MCGLCRQEPCHSRCPNAEEEKPVCTCGICNEGIMRGEKYYEVAQKCNVSYICENCLDDMTADEILFFAGEKMDIAGD